jgi:spore germination protein YaaH
MNSKLRNFPYLFWPLTVGMILGAGLLFIYQNRKQFGAKLLSPLGVNPEILATKVYSEKPIIGFLPYWSIKNYTPPYHLLDWLAYFSVTLNYDGSIQTKTDKGTDMGWYYLNSGKLTKSFEDARKQDVKLMLVVSAFNNEVIDTLIGNENSKKKAIESIKQLIKDYSFDGVNLDFEYNLAYEVVDGSGEKYASFIKELREELSLTNPEIIITVDLYGNGFIKDHPYKCNLLAKEADYLVLMGYDFHQTSSPKAGPVAPLKSEAERSITEAMDWGLRKGVDSNKIILAMPFYGYEWQTVSDDYGAATYPGTGAMASYKRVQALIEEKQLEVKWNVLAMSPWIAYEKDGGTFQIHFENNESIGLKLELIDQVKLGGGAIWALGYEGADASVWSVIENWRKKNANTSE